MHRIAPRPPLTSGTPTPAPLPLWTRGCGVAGAGSAQMGGMREGDAPHHPLSMCRGRAGWVTSRSRAHRHALGGPTAAPPGSARARGRAEQESRLGDAARDRRECGRTRHALVGLAPPGPRLCHRVSDTGLGSTPMVANFTPDLVPRLLPGPVMIGARLSGAVLAPCPGLPGRLSVAPAGTPLAAIAVRTRTIIAPDTRG